jgi:hypothetical protein
MEHALIHIFLKIEGCEWWSSYMQVNMVYHTELVNKEFTGLLITPGCLLCISALAVSVYNSEVTLLTMRSHSN